MTDLDLDEGERLLREIEHCSAGMAEGSEFWRGAWCVAMSKWERWRAGNAPALIAEVRRLRELVRELEEALDDRRF